MKRVVLRIAALGTVVVLGLIAIAQAQRRSEDLPPQADQLPLAGNPLATTRTSSAPASGADSRARTSLPVPRENPLRVDSRTADPSQRSPAANVLTAGQQDGPAVIQRTGATLPGQFPPADASALPTDRGSLGRGQSPAPLSETLPLVRGPAASDDSALPSYDAPPQRFSSQLTPDALASSAPAAGELPLRPSPGAPAAALAPIGAYPSSAARAADLGEPAMFRADPFASPAGGGSPYLAPPANRGPEAPYRPLSDTSAGSEATGKPGNKQLDGRQSPQLSIQKSAPANVQVGDLAAFTVTIQNTGPVTAYEVVVRDQVPKGTRLIGTTPRASRGTNGEVIWALGTLRPGEESSVEMQLEPLAEGEIGSVATVRFQADASARTLVTKPELVLRTSAPQQTLCGQQIALTVEISNRGSGVASGVVLEEHVPTGLEHAAGRALEYEIGDLPPGESRRLELVLLAKQPGPVTNVLRARGQGNLAVEDRINFEVIAPMLEVAVEGPNRRYLEREATYRLSIHNPGTAPAQQVQLVAYLPEGLRFVSANNSGYYEEATRAVHWALEELPTAAVGTVELTTMPLEAGRHTIRLHGSADRGVSAEGEHSVLVEGIAAIKFTVADVTDPIEVGGETSYEIHVENQGSKAATNVRLAVLLPAEMRAVAGEGPTRYVVQGNRVLFEGLPSLPSKDGATYRVRAEGLAPGDVRVSAQLLTDEMQTPVTKEESTRVYSDE